VLLAVALIAVLILSIYVLVEVPAMESQLSSLQSQNDNLQGQLAALGGQVDNLASQLQAQSSSTQTSSSPNLEVTACVSVNPSCSGDNHTGDVYIISLYNGGTAAFPAGYSFYLSFKDGTRFTFFGFNSTLPSSLTPNGNIVLNAASWPQNTNATSKMGPGDEVGLAVLVGSYETAIQVRILQCSTTTTTFLNATQTQTATLTNCS
jgi:hypothetical protein